MSKPYLVAAALALAAPAGLRAGNQADCTEFQRLVKNSYNFKPSKLTKAEQGASVEQMDRVWKAVEAEPQRLEPCLRSSLEEANADPWFQVDGSNLLVSVDPSKASKAIQVRAFLNADLDDVATSVWVGTLATRGAEGFDISRAGVRWLANPKLKYYLPQHGGFEVGQLPGAMFLFGSVDETMALDPLVKIASQEDHPGREAALWMLTMLATPEALTAMRHVNTAGLSREASDGFRRQLEQPELIEPAKNPAVSREEFIRVLTAATKVDWDKVDRLRGEQMQLEQSLRQNRQAPPDGKQRARLVELDREASAEHQPWDDMVDLFWSGEPTERDAAAVLRPEDLHLLRLIRRRMIAFCNQHAMERYEQLSQLLNTLVRKHPAMASSRAPSPERDRSARAFRR